MGFRGSVRTLFKDKIQETLICSNEIKVPGRLDFSQNESEIR